MRSKFSGPWALEMLDWRVYVIVYWTAQNLLHCVFLSVLFYRRLVLVGPTSTGCASLTHQRDRRPRIRRPICASETSTIVELADKPRRRVNLCCFILPKFILRCSMYFAQLLWYLGKDCVHGFYSLFFFSPCFVPNCDESLDLSRAWNLTQTSSAVNGW